MLDGQIVEQQLSALVSVHAPSFGFIYLFFVFASMEKKHPRENISLWIIQRNRLPFRKHTVVTDF